MGQSVNYRKELIFYLKGFSLALTLTVIPFAMIAWGNWSSMRVLALIGACAVLQIVVHFRYFFHIDFTRQKREDLQLILFSFLLLTIMTGGTIWIMTNLATRMH